MRVVRPLLFHNTPTDEPLSSLSVAIEMSVESWVGTAATARARAPLRGAMPPNVERINASSVFGSASPTATTAMRSGRYQSRQKRLSGAGLAFSRISGLPIGSRSA